MKTPILRFNLPYPPSVNSIWKRGKYGQYLSDEAKAFLQEATLRVKMEKKKANWSCLNQKLVVQYIPYHPDNRRHDCDNLFKLIGDAIQYAEVIENDSDLLPRCMDFHIDKTNPRIEVVVYVHH